MEAVAGAQRYWGFGCDQQNTLGNNKGWRRKWSSGIVGTTKVYARLGSSSLLMAENSLRSKVTTHDAERAREKALSKDSVYLLLKKFFYKKSPLPCLAISCSHCPEHVDVCGLQCNAWELHRTVPSSPTGKWRF
jgi:hypothetical protein